MDSCAAAVRLNVGAEPGAGGEDKRLATCFQKWDVDGNGLISVHELMRVLQTCGTKIAPTDLAAIFQQVDSNEDGVINYNEFLTWLYPTASSPSADNDSITTRSTSSPSKTRFSFSPTKSSPSVPVRAPLPHAKSCPELRMKTGCEMLVLLHSACQLPDSWTSECNASATAFVSKGGQAMEPKVHWPSSRQCSNPCWNTTRDLGCHTYNSSAAADTTAFLHVEISGSSSLIGDVRLPLADIIMDHWYDLPLELTASSSRKCVGKISPSVRFMIITEPSLVKKVFLIRHGESVWNKAQREKKVTQLLEQVDHPLSEEGLKQCLDLRDQVDAKKALDSSQLSANEAQFLDAQIALSSPLSRAIQTALVGLHPILLRLGRLRLSRNAREKRNLGGRDTTGTAMGEAEIIARVHSALRAAGAEESDIDRCLAVPLDSTEADNRWWNDSRESQSNVRERITEFMSQMRFLREERIIVVGHSHFFRALVKQGLTSSATIVGASRADVLSKKLVNCGVMAITLDFRRGADQPITEVELLLDSQLC